MTRSTEQQVKQTMIKQKEFARRRKQLMRMAGAGLHNYICWPLRRVSVTTTRITPIVRTAISLYLTGFREHDALYW